MRTAHAIARWLFVPLCLCSCSSVVLPGDGDVASLTDGSLVVDSSVVYDTPTSSDSPPDARPDDQGASTPHLGWVFAWQWTSGAGDTMQRGGLGYYVGAVFDRDFAPAVPAEGCVRAQSRAGRALLSAGTIRIEGPGSLMEPVRTSAGFYNLDGNGNPWMTGERLRVTASGGEIPAFRTEVQFPGLINLVVPTTTAGARLRVQSRSGLDLRWSVQPPSLPEQRLVVQLQVPLTPGDWSSKEYVRCSFPAENLEAVLDSTMLQGSQAPEGVLEVWSEQNVTVLVRDWRVTVRAGRLLQTALVAVE